MKIDRSIFRMDEVVYYADFILVPLYIIFLMHGNTLSLRALAGWLSAGMLLWTLIEYLLHRFVLHGTDIFGDQHQDHHQHPHDLVGNPPWVTFVLMSLAWTFIWIISNSNVASALTSGLLLGYLIFSEIHMQIHHADHPDNVDTSFSPFAYLCRHHRGHHRGGQTNFGVTTTLWDHIFRTKA